MSLSAYPASTGASPDEDWGDSPYGSLVSLGPRKLKKKPVLVLDPEELVKAHMAMAMGGAEIMEAMPDPEVAQRPRQPSSLLGLAPIGRDEDDEDMALYPLAAVSDPTGDDGSEDAEPEEDGPLASWQPDEEEGEVEQDSWVEETVVPPAPTSMDHLLRPARPAELEDSSAALPQSVIPSIEEQLKRMRALPGRPAPLVTAPPPAPEPEPEPLPVATSQVPTIQRLEIDDWSQLGALKGFVPARESDVAAPREPANPPPATIPPPAPARSQVPAPAPMPDPAPASQPVPAPPVAAPPMPPVQQVQAPEPLPEWEALDDDFAEALAPVAPPPRHSSLRARLVDPDYAPEGEAVRESLLGRLWAWLTRRR